MLTRSLSPLGSDTPVAGADSDWEKSITLKRLYPPRPALYTFVYEKGQFCNQGLHSQKFTLFFSLSQTGTKNADRKLARDGTLRRRWASTDQETCVGRYRKIGGSLEESARGAQRGLLVILASAVIWVAVIWIGYHVLY